MMTIIIAEPHHWHRTSSAAHMSTNFIICPYKVQHLDNKRQTDERVNTVNHLLLSDFLIVCVKGHPGHVKRAPRRAYRVNDDDIVELPANMWCGRRLVDRRYPRILF